MPALLQARGEPSLRARSRRLLDAVERAEHDPPLFLGRHRRQVAGVALVVPHELPAELHGVLDDLGTVVADLAVERDGTSHAVTGQRLHHAEDADTVTVVARRPVDEIGRLAGPTGDRLVQRKRLDVRDDPERHPGAIRPGEPRPPIDRHVGERTVTLGLHSALLPAVRLTSSSYVVNSDVSQPVCEMSMTTSSGPAHFTSTLRRPGTMAVA